MGKKSSENRRIVLDMLMELESDSKAKEHLLLTNVLNKYDYFDRQDKAFITYLFEGVLRNRVKIDYVISLYAKTKNGKIKPIVKNALRMGVFQILYMDSVPDSAACNESVNLVVDRGLSGLRGFVNGVLRNIAREKAEIKWPDKSKSFEDYLSVIYSMPIWIVKYLIVNYGKEKTEIMLSKMSEPASITIRLNEKLDKDQRQACIDSLDANGNSPIIHDYLDYAVKISKTEGMEEVPGFLEGLFTVQDVSSQLAVHVLPIKEGARVLDMCSAPGGKTMHAALKTGPKGHVDARELSEYKLDSIRENAERLGVDNISISQADATVYDAGLENLYDVVIVDAPCSGLGVMGKKSDIRYNVTAASINELVKIQRDILRNAVRYLKKDGVLLYSTCTLTKEENLDNRKWLLEEMGLRPVSFEANLPDDLKNQGGEDGYLQLLPGVHDSDGFFISLYSF